MAELLSLTPQGIYCDRGRFHIDPWQPVDKAVITHAHADHARPGSRQYLTAAAGQRLLQTRLPEATSIQGLPYGHAVTMNGVRVSFHPAGHVLGSAQVKVEADGEVWCVSGDYKLQQDPTATAFEPVTCHTFVSECTFGLPVYRWNDPAQVFAEINEWWRSNRDAGRASLIFAYALGKAQRLLAGLDASIGLIGCHGAIRRLNRAYAESGIELPDTRHASELTRKELPGALILAPPSSMASPWLKRFGSFSSALASGWMRIRGQRRRRSVDRGFVLSDHADWSALNTAIQQSQAERVIVTHGQTAAMVRWLREQGQQALAWPTRFSDFEETGEAVDSDQQDDN